MICMNNRLTTDIYPRQKQIPAHNIKSFGLECWQINLHRSRAASYNLCEVTKNILSGIILIQEPWTYGGSIRSKLRGWKLFQGNTKERPRAGIYVTPDITCCLMPQFSNEDVVVVRARNVRREGDSFIFASTYMAQEELAPPETLKELVAFSDKEKIPLVIGTDANAYHTIWGSTNVNPRGLELLMCRASANLYFCNVGNKPTFRTKTREEVLDLTLTNRNA